MREKGFGELISRVFPREKKVVEKKKKDPKRDMNESS